MEPRGGHRASPIHRRRFLLGLVGMCLGSQMINDSRDILVLRVLVVRRPPWMMLRWQSWRNLPK